MSKYAIADSIFKVKKKVTVRFDATKGSRIAAVFGIRIHSQVSHLTLERHNIFKMKLESLNI